MLVAFSIFTICFFVCTFNCRKTATVFLAVVEQQLKKCCEDKVELSSFFEMGCAYCLDCVAIRHYASLSVAMRHKKVKKRRYDEGI
jgi:hypothetical protein